MRATSDQERYRPIGDYALIGDCYSAALVESAAPVIATTSRRCAMAQRAGSTARSTGIPKRLSISAGSRSSR
jgi:hypothetical protein